MGYPSFGIADRRDDPDGSVEIADVAYDALGNVTSRSDVGSYGYHAVRKHAVVSAGSNSYTYDANGNMATRNGSTLTWTSDNLPASLSASGYTASFNYAPDRSRWRQVSTYAGATETTIYVGGLLEKLTTSVRVHWKHRIPTPSGEVQVIRRSDGTTDTFYVTTDHLGSTEAVMDGSGAILARESFGAWGARRGSNWSSSTPPDWTGIANTTRRGYTGHEALDNILLVHMNGRVYDPAIGRFLSADPYVNGIDASQGWNRYAYVNNGPLRYVDPSGYVDEQPDDHKRIRPIDPSNSPGAAWPDSGSELEGITVTATRLYPPTSDYLLQVSSPFGDVRAGSTEGGGTGGGDGGNDSREERHDQDCSNLALRAAELVVGGSMVITGTVQTLAGLGQVGAGISGVPVTGGGSLGLVPLGIGNAFFGASAVLDGGLMFQTAANNYGESPTSLGLIGLRYGGDSGRQMGDMAGLAGFAALSFPRQSGPINRANLALALVQQVLPILQSYVCEGR